MIEDLRPYQSYKILGIERLGEVPEHWTICRLRSVTSILSGATPSTSKPEYWDGEIVWVTPEDLGTLRSMKITSSNRKITAEGHASCSTSLGPSGSIALSTRAPIGHLGILTSDGCTNQGCRLLVPTADINPSYLYQVLDTARSELQSLGQGATFTELSRTKLGNFRLVIPSRIEQTAIVRFLDRATNQIEQAVNARTKNINLLKEYRTALVADIVTGQLDVSDADKELRRVNNGG